MPAEQFVAARAALRTLLKPGSVAVVNANDVPVTNSDGTMRFRQNSDLFYLSGVDQEETILLLAPGFPDEKYREILFIRETSETIAIWEGQKLTKDQARSQTGIQTICWTSEFKKIFHLVMVMGNTEHVYLNTNDHYRADSEVETRESRFVTWCREQYPLHEYERLAPLLHRLRSIKSPHEIQWLQKAIDITEHGFRRLLQVVKPGVLEYELEAELAHEFLRRGSRGFAYEPIIASGPNACILHYIENSAPCQDGEILLLDIGAEYGNYNADLTRSIPVNGRFTPRQRAVYNAVLKVLREAMNMLHPGVMYYEYHREVQKIMTSELIGLGLLSESEVATQHPDRPLVSRYFMHGTGHQLGLDVHDVGSMYYPIQAGQVWTVEPGIYIPAEGLGIRIENNVVVGEDEVTDLMANFPIEAEEIESLMNP